MRSMCACRSCARSVSASAANPVCARTRGLNGATPQTCPSFENASGGAPSDTPEAKDRGSAQVSAPCGWVPTAMSR